MRLPSDTPTKIALASTVALASVVIGGAAWLLKWLISVITHLVTSGFNHAGGNWYFILTALAGIIIVGFLGLENSSMLLLNTPPNNCKSD